MAAYRRVYDSRRLQADCQTGISSGTLLSAVEYGLPLKTFITLTRFYSLKSLFAWPFIFHLMWSLVLQISVLLIPSAG